MSGSGRLGCVVGLVLLATLSATACGAGASSGPHSLPALSSSATPAATPPSSATPAATPPSSASPSTPAASGKAAEVAAATAVVRRYYSLFNAATSLDTARQLGRLVFPRCKCQQVVRSFRDAARKHERYVGRGHLTAVRPEYNSPSRVGVLVSFNSTKSGLVRADGTYIHHVPAQNDVTEHLDLRLAAGDWRIEQVILISPGR